jgi:hypothetical protein
MTYWLTALGDTTLRTALRDTITCARAALTIWRAGL